MLALRPFHTVNPPTTMPLLPRVRPPLSCARTRAAISWRRCTAVAALLLTAFAIRAITVTAQDDPTSGLTNVHVESVVIDAIDLHGADVRVGFAATAGTNATLKSIVFEQVTLNGVRVSVPAVQGPVRLKAGEGIAGLPPLRVRVTFNEVESLEPVRRFVRQGAVDIHFIARAQLQLSPLASMVLLSRTVWVVSTVDQRMPLQLPGGELGRFTALAALTAAEPLWAANTVFRNALAALTESLDAIPSVASSLVTLETRYQLRSPSGEMVTMQQWSSGFAVEDGVIVAPAEAIEPWAFDEALAEGIASKAVTLVDDAFEIVATPGGTDTRARSTRTGDLKVLKRLKDDNKAVSATTRKRFPLRFRATTENAALLRLKDWHAPPLTMLEQPLKGSQPAAVIVPRWQRGRVEAAPLGTVVTFDNERYQLRDPLDAAAYGAPVWTRGGVAGVIQNEMSAADARAVLRKLK